VSETMTSGQIYKALAKVMQEVGVVGKSRKNPQQGYQFRGIDDVVAEVQEVLASHGVVVVPRVLDREREMIATKSGGTMASVRLLVEHRFFAEDGSYVVATTLGEAMDSGDKASNKAMSAALKYALTETLLIPTRESDRDTEEASPEMAARPAPQPLPAQRTATTRPASTARPAAPARPASSEGITFPNYGRAKGMPVSGAEVKDLEFYAGGCRKSLADPTKARFHDSERRLLAAIEAELQRHADPDPNNGAETADGPPPHSDEDAPF